MGGLLNFQMEARPTITPERVHNNGNGLLWRFVKDYPDIFDTHVVTKLNGNDVKFFYDVNRGKSSGDTTCRCAFAGCLQDWRF